MKYSDTDIVEALENGQIEIDPPVPPEGIGAVSVDLALGDHFRVFRSTFTGAIDLAPPGTGGPAIDFDRIMDDLVVPEGEAFVLNPGGFALGITRQRVRLSAGLAGRLDGRSSLARVGLMVHATAHTIDPGWDGRITLEFFNCGPLPLMLRPGMRICALSFEVVKTPTSKPYSSAPSSKYKDQHSPIPSRITRDRQDGCGPDADTGAA